MIRRPEGLALLCLVAERLHGRARLQTPDAPVSPAFKELAGWKPSAAARRDGQGRVVVGLSRSGTRPAGAHGRGLQPDGEAVRGAVSQRGRSGGRGARRPVSRRRRSMPASHATAAAAAATVPLASARRVCRPAEVRRSAAAPARSTASRQRHLGPRCLGPDPPPGRERRRRCAGQRGRSGECQTVGTGDAGHRLFRSARRGRPGETAGRDRRRLSARATNHAKPVSRRHVVEHRRRHGAGPAAIDPGTVGRGRRAAAAVRARDRGADRAPAGRTDLGPAAACHCRAGVAGGPALGPAGAASRHRGRRTHDAAAERADRRAGRRLLSRYLAVGAGRVRRHSAVAVVQRAAISFGHWAASGSETLFEGGLRTASVAAARANYD